MTRLRCKPDGGASSKAFNGKRFHLTQIPLLLSLPVTRVGAIWDRKCDRIGRKWVKSGQVTPRLRHKRVTWKRLAIIAVPISKPHGIRCFDAEGVARNIFDPVTIKLVTEVRQQWLWAAGTLCFAEGDDPGQA